MAAFNEHVKADSRVEAVLVTIRDGVTVAIKR
jgi:predicted O-methyltransferase YrrM